MNTFILLLVAALTLLKLGQSLNIGHRPLSRLINNNANNNALANLVRRSSLFAATSAIDYQTIGGVDINANLLRKINVKDINDKVVKLGDVMGPKKSVVVFLRHLG